MAEAPIPTVMFGRRGCALPVKRILCKVRIRIPGLAVVPVHVGRVSSRCRADCWSGVSWGGLMQLAGLGVLFRAAHLLVVLFVVVVVVVAFVLSRMRMRGPGRGSPVRPWVHHSVRAEGPSCRKQSLNAPVPFRFRAGSSTSSLRRRVAVDCAGAHVVGVGDKARTKPLIRGRQRWVMGLNSGVTLGAPRCRPPYLTGSSRLVVIVLAACPCSR